MRNASSLALVWDNKQGLFGWDNKQGLARHVRPKQPKENKNKVFANDAAIATKAVNQMKERKVENNAKGARTC